MTTTDDAACWPAPRDAADAFGILVARLAGQDDERCRLALRRIASTVWRAVDGGHVCVRTDQLLADDDAGTDVGTRHAPASVPLPAQPDLFAEPAPTGGADGESGADTRRALDRLRAAEGAALVVEHDRVWLRRYAAYESRVAERLHALDVPVPLGLPGQSATVVDELFPDPARAPNPAQREAIVRGLGRRLLVLTGGPGTGKTFTIAALVKAAQRLAPGLSVSVAAPTGKAAARLGEQLAASGVTGLATGTIDRLMGRGAGVRARHDRDDPLALDMLVIDECSMLGLASMARLLDALPDGARLVLVGDPGQLASIEAGGVFAQLGDTGTLPRALVRLEVGMRSADAAPVARFAALVRDGHDAAALQVLEAAGRDASSGAPALARIEPPAGAGELGAWWQQGYAELVAAAGSAQASDAALLEAASRFRVLCAHRDGPLGMEAFNRAIGAALRERIGASAGASAGGRAWRGRLVMVLRNDRATGLYNGDVGVCTGDGEVAFVASDGTRRIAWARLPEHEDAFAMTVHKSQGSEYRTVLLVPAPRHSPLALRELLYTGATRSKDVAADLPARLWICASPAAIREAVGRTSEREGALAARLRACERAG